MTIAYACVLFMGLLPYVAAGIAKKGFEGYDNSLPRQWLAKQTGFRARANAAQSNLFESLPLFFASVIIASVAHAPQGRIDLLAIGFVLARITLSGVTDGLCHRTALIFGRVPLLSYI